MKIGRNEQCHCGSGKKYKKCHIYQDDIPKEVFTVFKKNQEKKGLLESKGIYVNYIKPVFFKGKKIWALGNTIYSNPNPNQTFQDFIQDVLKDTLGTTWMLEQQLLPEDSQHHIFQCFSEFNDWRKKLLETTPEGGVYELPSTGWVKSMLTLAFDVATLKNCSNLPESLVRRLRTPLHYQGARYEIMIAAIIARLGFTIKWLDGEDTSKKHCEFIATHTDSKTQIAVEVKSRHRAGVLHTPGTLNDLKNCKGDVQHLLNQALKKSECGEMPFFVFIDINAPYKIANDFKDIPWIKDVLKRAEQEEVNSQENPSAHNAIYFTNFAFHYQTGDDAGHGQTLQALPGFPIFQIPDMNLYPAILNALHHYGYIPNIDVED